MAATAFVALIFLCICAILLGAVASPPIRWVVIVCAAISLILIVIGGLSITIGGPAVHG